MAREKSKMAKSKMDDDTDKQQAESDYLAPFLEKRIGG